MNIILISYTFPPSKAIGGKRWYNLGREISKSHNVHLITFCENVNKDSFASVTCLPSTFPKTLDSHPITTFDKLRYSFTYRLRLLKTKGYHLDKAATSKRVLQNCIRSTVRKKEIDVIITSGGPFSLLYNVLELKKESLFQNIHFVSDIRDPWCWGERKWLKSLHEKRLSFEKGREEFIITKSDLVTVPSEIMKKHLDSFYHLNASSIFHVPHGFDLEKIKVQNSSAKTSQNSKLKFIYGGTWYSDITQEFQEVVTIMDQLPVDFHFNIYTNHLRKAEKDLPKSTPTDKISISAYIPEEELFQEIYSSDCYILIFPKDYKDYLSAKYFEIFALKTPIIFIGKEGFVSEFLQKHKLGIHISPHNISMLSRVITQKEYLALKPNLDIEKNSFNSIANHLIKKLESIKK